MPTLSSTAEVAPIFEPLPLALCKTMEDFYSIDPDEYVQEPKIDGWRVQVQFADNEVAVYTRTNHIATGKMPAVEAGLRGLIKGRTVLDGEAVAIKDYPDFWWTAKVLGSGTDVAVEKQRARGFYVSFIAFDVLMMAGRDIRECPLFERREVLERIVEEAGTPFIRCMPQREPSVALHLEYTRSYGEGSVLKQIDAAYPKGRTKAFLKWKAVEEADVVIMGAVEGKGKFAGTVGALTFGQYKDGLLVSRGRCSGMTDEQRSMFNSGGSLNTRYLNRVMTVTHNGVLANGGFRHPQFYRLRDPLDKKAEDCVWT